jgi:hypothetical protein
VGGFNGAGAEFSGQAHEGPPSPESGFCDGGIMAWDGWVAKGEWGA